MARGPRSQSPGLRALYDRYVGDDPVKADAFEAAKANAEVAQAVYDLRTGAGLSQKGLAELVGTKASVICRLEDADYEGHSLSMLKRIAAALGKRVEIRFTTATARIAGTIAAVRTQTKKPAAKIKVAKAVKATPTKAKAAPVVKATAKRLTAKVRKG